ncbi:50S ribosomal protein L29 [Candidatus Kaiserbacteria bacterium]|nr:50S ribosomal protein L29 [Candidatus Kaiserbacteria bacterium]
MADFKKQSIEDIRASVTALREQLRASRFGGAGSRARNVREGRATRKEIARALTELRARGVALETK